MMCYKSVVLRLVASGWQQGLDSQFTGAQRRVRRGAGAQQLGAQQVGSQQVSWQSSTCQEEPMQALGELTWLPQLKSLEQTDKVDAATTQVLEQQVSANGWGHRPNAPDSPVRS